MKINFFSLNTKIKKLFKAHTFYIETLQISGNVANMINCQVLKFYLKNLNYADLYYP
jgi:hypothetical protein